MCEPSSPSDFTLVQLLGDSQFFILNQLNLTVSLCLLTLLKSPFHSILLRSIHSINAFKRNFTCTRALGKVFPGSHSNFQVYFEIVYFSFQLLPVKVGTHTVVQDLVNSTLHFDITSNCRGNYIH